MDNQSVLQYRKAAHIYRPERIKFLFLAESPPAYNSIDKKSYFFFEKNPGSDILFATIVKAIFELDYRKADGNKTELLQRFKDEGFWLVDAVEEPINKVAGQRTPEKERERLIRKSIPDLLSRLERLKQEDVLNHKTGIILIKKVVHHVLYSVLTTKGYHVLNEGKIDFPKYHNDRDTIRGIQLLLR
jgi:hypothetical protein